MTALLLGLALGGELVLPESLAVAAVSEDLPGGRTPVALSVDDIAIAWDGDAIDGVSLAWVPDSIQWVRVSQILLVPTAQIEVSLASGTGALTTAGRTTPLSSERPTAVTVAVLTGADNPLVLRVGGQDHTLTLRRTATGPIQVSRDTTCSRNRVDWTVTGDSASWAYIGCRRSWTHSGPGRDAVLELFVLWDGDGPMTVNGAKVPSATTNTAVLRVAPEPGQLTLSRPEGDQMALDYHLRRRVHSGLLGLSVGPVLRLGSSDGGSIGGAVTRAHLMYDLSEHNRLVLADTFTWTPDAWVNDLGGYYAAKTLSLFDNRAVVYTLLGGHLQTFPEAPGGVNVNGLTFPQGGDVLIEDLPFRSYWLRFGGFVQPPIRGRWYYQAYIRTGQVLFVEANLVSWRQAGADDTWVRHERVQLTLGSQLLPFL